MSVQLARNAAEMLIHGMGLGPPIDVERLAQRHGLPVVPMALPVGVSGLLVTRAQTTYICVQRADAATRQRFTIAHELGHHVLGHQFEPGAHVHVDRGNFISQRGSRAAAGVDPKEIEANQFAANLLMPAHFIRKRASEVSGGPLFDGHVALLAQEFGVSEQAMVIRLSSLGLL